MNYLHRRTLKKSMRMGERQPCGILIRLCDSGMTGCKGRVVTKRDSLCDIYLDNGRAKQCCQGELPGKNKCIICQRPPL